MLKHRPREQDGQTNSQSAVLCFGNINMWCLGNMAQQVPHSQQHEPGPVAFSPGLGETGLRENDRPAPFCALWRGRCNSARPSGWFEHRQAPFCALWRGRCNSSGNVLDWPIQSAIAEAALRRLLLLLLWLWPACWLPPAPHAVVGLHGDGNISLRRLWAGYETRPLEPLSRTSSIRIGTRPTGWRRTALGWEEASHWRLRASIGSVPTSAAAVHPLVIASLQLLVSIGALLVGSSARKSRR